MSAGDTALGLIGGTGLATDLGAALGQPRLLESLTPHGMASAPVAEYQLPGTGRLLFLPRHGERHQFLPHQINTRANLWSLHALGARRVLALNSVGGIARHCQPGALVIPDQLIDNTWGRPGALGRSGSWQRRHVEFGHPFDPKLVADVAAAADRVGVPVHVGGCYGVAQGPRLETHAEIRRLQDAGCDMVGMTAMPEALVAREQGVAYAMLAVVGNRAAGLGMGVVDLDEVLAELAAAAPAVTRIVNAWAGVTGSR